jgi:diguanylate cyclase (GGDEF)-like protein/PAS domain S-box-containing protein
MNDINGLQIGGICANIDISERIYAEQALQESEERWQLAMRGNNDGIWDWNLRKNTTFFSERCGEILGFAPGECDVLSREEWLERAHPDDIEKVREEFNKHIDGESEYFIAEYRVLCNNGNYKWVLDRAQGLWDKNYDLARVCGSLTDITERKEYESRLQDANVRLEELAMRDGLTGVYNRRAMEERLAMEYERVRRYKFSLSVIMVDVDHFKRYNDSFGHQQGDEVLREFAKILDRNTRDVDFVSRYGGEEFIILLPHTSLDGSKSVAERCINAIRSFDWPGRSVTASFGVSSIDPEDNIDWENLLRLADEAMYASKRNGRNQITYILPDG